MYIYHPPQRVKQSLKHFTNDISQEVWAISSVPGLNESLIGMVPQQPLLSTGMLGGRKGAFASPNHCWISSHPKTGKKTIHNRDSHRQAHDRSRTLRSGSFTATQKTNDRDEGTK